MLSLLSGARTEEVRPLLWSHVFLPESDEDEKVLAHVRVWRSVRTKGDTKTKRSRRSLAIPKRCVDELRKQQTRQERKRKRSKTWQSNGLVFASRAGSVMEARNVRRAFRRVAGKAGLNAEKWTPRELRHSFVSLLSDRGVPIEQIARLVGHRSTLVTEQIYRHQLTPIVEAGATTMDEIFPVSAPSDEEDNDAA